MGGGSSFSPKQQNWHWYSDTNAEPVGGDSLAAENNKPTLADGSNIRLRICINETGGKASNNAITTLEYSTNDVDFSTFGAANHWDYANGQATEGNTITGNLLSDASTLGRYCESATATVSYAASSQTEVDICIAPTANASAGTDYYFRFLIGGTVVDLNTGETHPVVTTASTVNTDRTPLVGSSQLTGGAPVMGLGITVPTEVDV